MEEKIIILDCGHSVGKWDTYYSTLTIKIVRKEKKSVVTTLCAECVKKIKRKEKKMTTENVPQLIEVDKTGSPIIEKRKRGRPRIHLVRDPNVPGRSRGRPKGSKNKLK